MSNLQNAIENRQARAVAPDDNFQDVPYASVFHADIYHQYSEGHLDSEGHLVRRSAVFDYLYSVDPLDNRK